MHLEQRANTSYHAGHKEHQYDIPGRPYLLILPNDFFLINLGVVVAVKANHVKHPLDEHIRSIERNGHRSEAIEAIASLAQEDEKSDYRQQRIVNAQAPQQLEESVEDKGLGNVHANADGDLLLSSSSDYHGAGNAQAYDAVEREEDRIGSPFVLT